MATVDSVAILALSVLAVVGTVLVRSRQRRQALDAEQAARFAPLVALFDAAGRPGTLVRDTYRGRAYLMRRVRAGADGAGGAGGWGGAAERVVVEIEMPSFGGTRWLVVRRGGPACGPSNLPVPAGGGAEGGGLDGARGGGRAELLTDDADLRRAFVDHDAMALMAGLGDDDLTVGYEPRRQCLIYRERVARASLATGPALRHRLDVAFELVTLSESAQRL